MQCNYLYIAFLWTQLVGVCKGGSRYPKYPNFKGPISQYPDFLGPESQYPKSLRGLFAPSGTLIRVYSSQYPGPSMLHYISQFEIGNIPISQEKMTNIPISQIGLHPPSWSNLSTGFVLSQLHRLHLLNTKPVISGGCIKTSHLAFGVKSLSGWVIPVQMGI